MLFMVILPFTFFISKYVMKFYNPSRILDIGCGTGFQSFLYAFGGSSVVGIDVSENMIKSAMNKRKSFLANDKLILFPANFHFVTRYNEIINSVIWQRTSYKEIFFAHFFSL
jgi:2-polyprenyl-3-methyl-5-hydroxy-6-metoxy-1,4-benzoquinol methylase